MARNDRGPMAGRTMLVTGATSGIGKATAVALARVRGPAMTLIFPANQSLDRTRRETPCS